MEWIRQKIADWFERPLEAYYPVLYIDALQIKVRRQSIATETFYVIRDSVGGAGDSHDQRERHWLKATTAGIALRPRAALEALKQRA